MKIVKYAKLKNNLYNIYFDDGSCIKLYEDVILKFDLLIKGYIDEKLLVDVNNYNEECKCYFVAIKSLNCRIKSIYDCKLYLENKGFTVNIVDKVINKLVNQGYLNDDYFSSSYINNQIFTTKNGPKKIINELLKHRISQEIIEKNIVIFDYKIQNNQINKIIKKMISSNHDKGSIILKNKIYSHLINLGYYPDIINENLNLYKFGVDHDIQVKEYNKLYKKYSKKYSGIELENIIKNNLYKKGLYYEN